MMTKNMRINITNNLFFNTGNAKFDLCRQKELIHADVRQQAVVVQEEILQVAGNIALLLFMRHFVFLNDCP